MTVVEVDAARGRTLTSWPSLKTEVRNAGGTWVDKARLTLWWALQHTENIVAPSARNRSDRCPQYRTYHAVNLFQLYVDVD